MALHALVAANATLKQALDAFLGHAGSVAWAITNAMADYQDLFREELRRDRDGVWAREVDGWSRCEVRIEQIPVRHDAVVNLEAIETVRGPVIIGGPGEPTYSLRTPTRVEADAGFRTLLPLLHAKTAADVTAAGFKGILTNALYDTWWHGGFRTAPYYHNSIGILTEAASARLMTPSNTTREQLSRSGTRGKRSAMEVSTNFPNPWPGGVWRPRESSTTSRKTIRSPPPTPAPRRNRRPKVGPGQPAFLPFFLREPCCWPVPR